jgi:hypothetical protein
MSAFLLGFVQTALIAVFTYLVVKRHERKRESQVSKMLMDLVAQLILWIWYFQDEGQNVRKNLDEGKEINPWIAAMITEFRGHPRGQYLQHAITAPVPAKRIVQSLAGLPDELCDWQQSARRIQEIARTIYSLLPLASATASTELAESIARAELVAADTLHSLDSAVAACNLLLILSASKTTMENPEELHRLLFSIDAGIIGVWRVMYLDTAQVYDRLQSALRKLPADLQKQYDHVISRLTSTMPEHPPLTTDPTPKPLHPRQN